MEDIKNIYIDARKLNHEERLNAFTIITELTKECITGWWPHYLASYGGESEFKLFDIFGVDQDGDRAFLSGSGVNKIDFYMESPKELSYKELVSLAEKQNISLN